MKITQADTPTIRMDCHPSRLIGAHISAIPTIFTPDALPGTTLPIYPGLGQAPSMLACIGLPSGLVRFVSDVNKATHVKAKAKATGRNSQGQGKILTLTIEAVNGMST